MPADLTMATGLALPSPLARVRAYVLSRHWTFLTGATLFAVILTLIVFAPWISGHDPAKQALLLRLKPPSAEHWLGTDNLGRDLFSRILHGGRFTVSIAAITVVLTVVIGTIVGVISGRKGGFVDDLLMRVVDLLLSVPDAIIAIFLVAIIGPGFGTLVLALTIVGWTPYARLARGLTMEVNSRDYIRAAEVLGMSRSYIVFRHVIPNMIRPISAVSFLRFGHKLITVGGLSFLGLGVQPPASDWGLMLADAQPFLERAPMLMIAPGLAIFLTALSVTWIGQGLEIDRRGPQGH
jgi:peptide/nickel transport system permease protein